MKIKLKKNEKIKKKKKKMNKYIIKCPTCASTFNVKQDVDMFKQRALDSIDFLKEVKGLDKD
jgi:hypothetical protein